MRSKHTEHNGKSHIHELVLMAAEKIVSKRKKKLHEFTTRFVLGMRAAAEAAAAKKRITLNSLQCRFYSQNPFH